MQASVECCCCVFDDIVYCFRHQEGTWGMNMVQSGSLGMMQKLGLP